jgi:hypothetical protein
MLFHSTINQRDRRDFLTLNKAKIRKVDQQDQTTKNEGKREAVQIFWKVPQKIVNISRESRRSSFTR